MGHVFKTADIDSFTAFGIQCMVILRDEFLVTVYILPYLHFGFNYQQSGMFTINIKINKQRKDSPATDFLKSLYTLIPFFFAHH